MSNAKQVKEKSYKEEEEKEEQEELESTIKKSWKEGTKEHRQTQTLTDKSRKMKQTEMRKKKKGEKKLRT